MIHNFIEQWQQILQDSDLPIRDQDEVFVRVLEIKFLRNGDAIVAHDWRSPFPLYQHRL
jgi:hypothetical protein